MMGELLYPEVDKPPIFVSAGVIKTEAQIEQFAMVPDIAAQVIGSFSEEEWRGNDPSGMRPVFWWDEVNKAAYNAIGLKNPGSKAASRYLPGSIQRVHDVGQMAIISVTALAHEEPLETLPRLAEWALDMGADGVEIDGSCPNHGSLLCENIKDTHELVTSVRQRVGEEAYVSMKFSDLPHETREKYKRSKKLPLDAIVLINAIRSRSPVNPQTRRRYIDVNDGYAGKSGPAISRVARDNLRTWSFESREKLFSNGSANYHFWSVGGVENGREVFDRVNNLGAFMVGSAQLFYKSKNPRAVARKLADEYAAAVKEAVVSPET